MNKILFFSAFATAALTACAATAGPNYKVKVSFPDDSNDDAMAYFINFDSGEKVDSAIVTEGVALFQGNIDAPAMARLSVDGGRGPMFILEPAEMTLDASTGNVTGGALNDRLQAIGAEMDSIVKKFQQLPQDSLYATRSAELEKAYNAIPAKAFSENTDNPIGLYFFLQEAYGMDLPTLEAQLKKYPALAKSVRVGKLKESLVNKAATGVGAMFKDFTISYEGKDTKLSDYVGKGKYTLVDFWASWCGPCMREIETLKKIYAEYHDKGLDILGVAVWDEPQATLAAMEQKQIPWPVIINAQTIPTDLYGISGIPCIILFDPQGKIVSRDKQGQDLVADVAKAMESKTNEE